MFDPMVGDALELLYPIGLGDGAGLAGEYMNMIADAAYLDRYTFELPGDGTQIRVHFGA